MSQTLLLHADGSDGATTTVDSSEYSNVVTLNNSAKLSTTQKKFGVSSLRLDGSTFDSVTIAADASIDFESPGNATLDFQVYLDSLATDQVIAYRKVDADNGWWLSFDNATNDITFISKNVGVTKVSLSGGTLTAATFHHVAITCDGTMWRLLIDGVLIDSQSYSGIDTFPDLTAVDLILGFETGSAFTGYIDEFRLLLGEAEWATAFTAPVSAWDDVRNHLFNLLHFDESPLVDHAPNSHIPTLVNSAYIDSNGKFKSCVTLAYGTLDYVNVACSPNMNFKADDYTIEMQVKQTVLVSYKELFGNYISSTNHLYAIINSAGRITYGARSPLYSYSSIGASSSINLTSGVYNHVAITRRGRVTRLFINGAIGATYTATSNDCGSPNLSNFKIGEVDGLAYQSLDGSVDEFRILKGHAKWTAAFTPPAVPWTPPYEIAQQLKQLYDLGEFAIAQLEQLYDLTTAAVQQLEQLYSIRLETQLEQPFSIRVEADLTQPIHTTITAQLEELYALNSPVAQQLEQLYDLLVYNPVAQQLEQPFSINVETQLEQIYSLNGEIAQQFEQIYSLTNSVAQQLEEPYELLVYNPVAQQLEERYDLISAPAINITDQPYILFNGNQIEIKTASISSAENSFIWDAQIELARIEDYVLFNQDDEIELNLLGENYKLNVVSKSMNKIGGDVNSSVSISTTLTASSPAIKYAFPRATGITKTWDIATLAKDIAEEVTGETIDWQLVNWYIPAGKLSVINAAPISIVQQLAEAAGGIVESKKDGSLLVRDAFPISVKDWDTASADQSYSDISDAMAVSEMYNFIDRTNSVLITDGFDESSSDSIEYKKDEGNNLAGTIKVYPNPYRSVELYHTSLDNIGLIPQGEVIRTEAQELVEFKGGKASLSYPVYGITSVIWKYDDLGSVSFTADKRDISASDSEGYSLALITYQTRSYNFKVSSPIAEAVQFIIRGL